MGKPHIDALRISPNFTSTSWSDLDGSLEASWAKAAEIVEDRLDGRFLKFATDALKGSEFSGFVVLAIDSLLLETIQQFREGCIDGYGKSEKMIKNCLKGRHFQPAFDPHARKRYYKDIRCGLLHQAEAKEMWLVRRGEPEMLQRWPGKDGYTIDVIKFHKAVKATFKDYLGEIIGPANIDLRAKLWDKMDHICRIRGQRGAAISA